MTPSDEKVGRFFASSADLIREILEGVARDDAAGAAALAALMARGLPLALTLLFDRDGPKSLRVLAPTADGAGTFEIAALTAARASEH